MVTFGFPPSGMILRSWEDRSLGINNSIRGLNAKYRINDKINFTTLGLNDQQQTISVKISDPYFDIPYSPEIINVNCIDGPNYFVNFTSFFLL